MGHLEMNGSARTKTGTVYHQETVPVQGLAAVCNQAAKDGWRVNAVTGPIPAATSALAGGQMVPVFIVLFERQETQMIAE